MPTEKTELSNLHNIPSSKEVFTQKDSFEHAQRVAKMICSSDLVPARFRGNVQNTMIAMEMANRLGASPIMVMQNLYIVHGSPGWSGQFIISCINSCGRFKPLNFEGDGETWCRAIAKDKETGEVRKGAKVTVEMAKAEGWWEKIGTNGKNSSKWPTMTEQMLMYRAASFFGRVHCPDVLMGMYTVEEIEDYTVMSDMSMDAYLESLINNSIYADEVKDMLRSKIEDGLTKEEAVIISNELASNQLDPITHRDNVSQKEILNALNRKVKSE